MKRVLAICLALVMVMTMGISVLAAADGATKSPTGKPAPGLIEFKPKDEDCTGKLIVTPYSKRDRLPDAYRELLEKAYDEVKTAEDLTKLHSDLSKLAADKNVKSENLTVSELFNIHVVGCKNHEGHREYHIVLEVASLKNFVGLMYMTEDGEWLMAQNVSITNDGKYLEFDVYHLERTAPFSIVVSTEGSQPGTDVPQPENPQPEDPTTGDVNYNYIYIAIMAVCLVALVVVIFIAKKRK